MLFRLRHVVAFVMIGLFIGYVFGFNSAIKCAEPQSAGNGYEITFGCSTHYYE